MYKSFFRKIAEAVGIDDWDLKLVQGEENDKLAELQREGVEIQNMSLLQQMGFDVSMSHNGEFKVSKDPVNQPALPDNSGVNGRGRSEAAPEENRQKFEGSPMQTRPSDTGGIAQGSPSSGSGTSLSQKNFPDGITPANFTVIKKTLQTAVDFGWNKTKTIEEIRKYGGLTVRQARELVKNEFEQMRRWEDAEEKE
jgi:hypothetical protein